MKTVQTILFLTDLKVSSPFEWNFESSMLAYDALRFVFVPDHWRRQRAQRHQCHVPHVPSDRPDHQVGDKLRRTRCRALSLTESTGADRLTRVVCSLRAVTSGRRFGKALHLPVALVGSGRIRWPRWRTISSTGMQRKLATMYVPDMTR